jgi:hypothetical protein
MAARKETLSIQRWATLGVASFKFNDNTKVNDRQDVVACRVLIIFGALEVAIKLLMMSSHKKLNRLPVQYAADEQTH